MPRAETEALAKGVSHGTTITSPPTKDLLVLPIGPVSAEKVYKVSPGTDGASAKISEAALAIPSLPVLRTPGTVLDVCAETRPSYMATLKKKVTIATSKREATATARHGPLFTRGRASLRERPFNDVVSDSVAAAVQAVPAIRLEDVSWASDGRGAYVPSAVFPKPRKANFFLARRHASPREKGRPQSLGPVCQAVKEEGTITDARALGCPPAKEKGPPATTDSANSVVFLVRDLTIHGIGTKQRGIFS